MATSAIEGGGSGIVYSLPSLSRPRIPGEDASRLTILVHRGQLVSGVVRPIGSCAAAVSAPLLGWRQQRCQVRGWRVPRGRFVILAG
jgi:hypothetical protein